MLIKRFYCTDSACGKEIRRKRFIHELISNSECPQKKMEPLLDVRSDVQMAQDGFSNTCLIRIDFRLPIEFLYRGSTVILLWNSV
jgi:hypothetical protein